MSEEKVGGIARGFAFITLAKLFFIVSGFAVQVGLPRLLGSPVAFGKWSLAMSITNVIDNVLIATTVQSLSKRVSENEALAKARLRQGLKLQLAIGAGISLSLIFCAPWLARLAYDSELTVMLRVAGVVPFCYALYAALVGTLNGLRKFRAQAGLDITFSTVRTLGILGAAALGYGAIGAIYGFALAAFVILTVALIAVGTGTHGESLPLRVWFGFLLPLATFQLMLNGLLLLDVWVLQNTAAGLFLELGHSLPLATSKAQALVGNYRAAQNFAFVPYQVIMAVTFVVFPLISRATAAGDLRATRVHVRNALRFSLLVLFALAAPLGASAEALIRLAYGKQFLAAAPTLTVLVFGQLSLSLFVIMATILSSAGKPSLSALIGAIALTVMVLANRYLVRSVGIGAYTLSSAALASSAGSLLAMILANFALKQVFQEGLPSASALRAGIAALGACALGRLIPQHHAWMAPVTMLASAALYTLFLFVLGELAGGDLARVLAVLKRGRPKPA